MQMHPFMHAGADFGLHVGLYVLASGIKFNLSFAVRCGTATGALAN